MKVRLPETISKMIGIVAEGLWHIQESYPLESSYPNWAVLGDAAVKLDEAQMGIALAKWQSVGIRKV